MSVSIFNKLKRRNVFRIAAADVVGAWLLIQVTESGQVFEAGAVRKNRDENRCESA